jgi:hypothetical protein
LRRRQNRWLMTNWPLEDMAPTLVTSCTALPPEGATAPAARQSRSRGPCLKGMSRLQSLIFGERFEISKDVWGTPAAVAMAPTLVTSCAALPTEGAAAPAARQSRSSGPCLKGMSRLRSLIFGERFEISKDVWGDPAVVAMVPTLVTPCTALPHGGLAWLAAALR